MIDGCLVTAVRGFSREPQMVCCGVTTRLVSQGYGQNIVKRLEARGSDVVREGEDERGCGKYDAWIESGGPIRTGVMLMTTTARCIRGLYLTVSISISLLCLRNGLLIMLFLLLVMFFVEIYRAFHAPSHLSSRPSLS
jgi:hypothetical protein